MPNIKEKLIALLCQATFGVNKQTIESYLIPSAIADVADHLIANGVTVQKWIPGSERLPGGMDWVLCACKDNEVRILAYDYIMDDWDIFGRPNSYYGKGFVTHWMPLPEPPKNI